jgi:hypothetical protein
MARYKFARPFGLMLASIVAALTLAVAAHAAQTFLTPNEAVFSYNLAASSSGAPITPVASAPVLVMGVDNTANERGIGFVTLLRVPGTFLQWVGLQGPGGVSVAGHSKVAGTHIAFLDLRALVDLRVNTADTFVVHNANSSTQNIVITLIW